MKESKKNRKQKKQERENKRKQEVEEVKKEIEKLINNMNDLMGNEDNVKVVDFKIPTRKERFLSIFIQIVSSLIILLSL